MTEHRVIRADFSDFRRVKGRKVMQLFLEIPLEEAEEALRILGHPKVGESTWCAVALLNAEADAPQAEHSEGGPSKKPWAEVRRSQQAGILCSDPAFWQYFGVKSTSQLAPEHVAATKLRDHFRITSRSELDDPANHARWDEFVALYHLDRQRYAGVKHG